MELRPGYKETDIGIFPDDWEVGPLGNYATFRTGPFGSSLHKSDYTVGGVPVVNPMHIVDGGIQPTEAMTITEPAAKNLSEFRLKPGEIVIGRRGDMGRCAVVREHQAGWLCGTGSMIVRPRNIDAEFLRRVLSSPEAIASIEDASVGTTMVNLNQGTLSGLQIQYPSPPEQHAIATALSDVDALLDGLDRLITKKRDIKQAAMHQLLTGKTRLPGFEGEWEEVHLADLLQMRATYGIVKAGVFQTSGIPMLRGGDIKNGRIGSDMPFVTQEKSDEFSRTVLKKEDVVIALVGYPGEAAKVPSALEGANISRAVGLLRLEKQVSPDFLVAFLNSPIGRKIVLAPSAGSAQIVVNLVELNKLVIRLPPLKEQFEIATVVSDMNAEIEALEKRRTKTRDLKQAMMQELLTGRTRLV